LEQADPVEAQEQDKAVEHGDLHGDAERGAERITEHRTEAVPGRARGADVQRVGDQPTRETNAAVSGTRGTVSRPAATNSCAEGMGESANVLWAFQAVRGHRPDVLVLELNMPGGSSIAAIRRLGPISPKTRWSS
jgi:CheY-like chemotaxis protein